MTHEPGREVIAPVWSPDGRKLLYQIRNVNSYVIDANRPGAEQTPQGLSGQPPPGFIPWDLVAEYRGSEPGAVATGPTLASGIWKFRSRGAALRVKPRARLCEPWVNIKKYREPRSGERVPAASNFRSGLSRLRNERYFWE
jgi:hypothetical protein